MTHAYLSFGTSSYSGKAVLKLTDSSVVNVRIPATFGSQNVVEVGRQAFDSANIESVFIPKTMIYLNNGAFYDCLKLKEVKFEAGCALTKIDINAFKSKIIENIDLPASLSNIVNNDATYTTFRDVPLKCVSYLGTAQINSYMFTNYPVVHVKRNYPYSTFGQRTVTKDGRVCDAKRGKNSIKVKRKIPFFIHLIIVCLSTS